MIFQKIKNKKVFSNLSSLSLVYVNCSVFNGGTNKSLF